jgi:lysophospholipase L1-like esterase
MKFVILIGPLLVVVLYFTYPLFHAIRVSKEIQQDAVPYEQHPENATMRILIAGDSTGVGTGATNPSDSIAGRIGKDFPNADITNISENGITLKELKNKLYAQPENVYDLVVLQIGANDITGFTSKRNIQSELEFVLNYAESHASSVVVLTAGNVGLAPVFRFPLSSILTSRTLMVKELFEKEAVNRASVTYVDLFKTAENEVFNTDIDRYYAKDRFHPSGEGYGEWYKDVRKTTK